MALLQLCTLFWLLGSISAIPSSQGDLGLIFNTTNGLVIGHHAPNVSGVIEALGIAYAQPPIGNLRFAAPQKYEGSSSYEASNWVSRIR